jgi:tRNA pseudouridine55 synthase
MNSNEPDTGALPQIHSAQGAVLNINKPEGWTSFDVVKKVRGILSVRKVGHTGTLDPFATGVLLICVGRATKKVESLLNCDKEYRALVVLGKRTDTFDRTGKILAEAGSGDITEDHIKQHLPAFTGQILQIPPMFSAVKVGGERLYKKARRGEVIERKPRAVYVHELEIETYRNPELRLRIVCSKGTYIRALANDLGERLRCGAYLHELTRTRVGSYHIRDAINMSEFVAAYS